MTVKSLNLLRRKEAPGKSQNVNHFSLFHISVTNPNFATPPSRINFADRTTTKSSGKTIYQLIIFHQIKSILKRTSNEVFFRKSKLSDLPLTQFILTQTVFGTLIEILQPTRPSRPINIGKLIEIQPTRPSRPSRI